MVLYQGRPGDETATAFCVPILERVLERYPTCLAPKAGSAEVSPARAPASEAATPPRADAQVYQLVALVMTRTREMATDIAVSRRCSMFLPVCNILLLCIVWVSHSSVAWRFSMLLLRWVGLFFPAVREG